MTKPEAINLFRWLAISFPKQYGNLSDEEVQTIVENLAWCFRFNTYTDVLQEYRNAYTRQKTAPHPSEIIQALPANIHNSSSTKRYTTLEELQKMPEYSRLIELYGEDFVLEQRKNCYVDGSLAELKWWIERELFYQRYDAARKKSN